MIKSDASNHRTPSFQKVIDSIRANELPLRNADDLQPLVEAIGDAQYVLLGEASHGTSEFYTWRAELTKKLIEQKGFRFIAVEGDWPACYELNRYIKGYSEAGSNVLQVLEAFHRWPTWMWANREIAALADWLKQVNGKRQEKDRIGFYGLDVYSIWESMDEIMRYLREKGSGELDLAKKAFECFEPFRRDEQRYGVSAAFYAESCEDEVVELLQGLQSKRKAFDRDDEAALGAELNALVAVNAERYYRAMVKGGPESWNIRDRHMEEVLARLTAFHGQDSKVIIWEHNTHIGDARATDMKDEGMINLGQLLREKADRGAIGEVYAVGFSTNRGTVIAAKEWGAPMKEMKVPVAEKGSWEDAFHQAGSHDKMLIISESAELSDSFRQQLGHRAIGVVYHPDYEWGNYVPTVLSDRYDAMVYIDDSHALHPLVLQEAGV